MTKGRRRGEEVDEELVGGECHEGQAFLVYYRVDLEACRAEEGSKGGERRCKGRREVSVPHLSQLPPSKVKKEDVQ